MTLISVTLLVGVALGVVAQATPMCCPLDEQGNRKIWDDPRCNPVHNLPPCVVSGAAAPIRPNLADRDKSDVEMREDTSRILELVKSLEKSQVCATTSVVTDLGSYPCYTDTTGIVCMKLGVPAKACQTKNTLTLSAPKEFTMNPVVRGKNLYAKKSCQMANIPVERFNILDPADAAINCIPSIAQFTLVDNKYRVSTWSAATIATGPNESDICVQSNAAATEHICSNVPAMTVLTTSAPTASPPAAPIQT
jgi:hypothetical protein